MNNINIPTALIILDGWGWREETQGNAIAAANTPIYDRLLKHYPVTQISGSGEDVGLPSGQMGNSEVGHLTIGAGRVKLQDLARINQEIENKKFFENKAFIDALKYAQQTGANIHVCGLFSDGGVHSHQNHLFALLSLTQRFSLPHVFVHAFLDGRDTKPKCALETLNAFDLQFKNCNIEIATVSGRFYAMDRDNRWERIEQAFVKIAAPSTNQSPHSPTEYIHECYDHDTTDEFIPPYCLLKEYPGIQPHDVVFFMNFRADRARQLSRALTDESFSQFDRKNFKSSHHLVTLTEYQKNLNAQVAYPPQKLYNVLGEVLSKKGLRQLRLAETEKYAHVTYFFNGGIDQPFPLESRILVPSVKVKTYDQHPQMSAYEITEHFKDSLLNHRFDVIICNFANADMVGHTGNFEATVSAIETLDKCLGEILDVLKQVSGQALITADHGNADCMYQENSLAPHTAHTTSLVPLIYVGKRDFKFSNQSGTLCDVTPTLLRIMNIEQPIEMTGKSLIP